MIVQNQLNLMQNVNSVPKMKVNCFKKPVFKSKLWAKLF